MQKILNEPLYISDSNPIKARIYDYKSFTYPWHFHCEYEMLYVENGYGQCIIGDSMTGYTDQTVFLFGSELPHCMQNPAEYEHNENLRVNGTIIQFEKNFMQYAFSHYIQFANIRNLLNEASRGIRFEIRDNPDIAELLKKIPLIHGAEQIILFLQLLLALSEISNKQLVASHNYNPVPSGFKGEKIEKVIAYINKKYTNNISLKEIASYAAMNPTAFCRFFKEHTGKSLKHYIINMRIGYACKLLADKRLNISEVSLECGYESVNHFIRCFKSIMNCTPTNYRKRILHLIRATP